MNRFQLTTDEERVLRDAKHQGYILTRRRNPRLAHHWSKHCDKVNTPVLKITLTEGGKATLFFDCLSCRFALRQQAQDTIHAMCRLIGGQWHKITPNFVWGRRIPQAHAELLARFIVELVSHVPSTTEHYVRKIA